MRSHPGPSLLAPCLLGLLAACSGGGGKQNPTANQTSPTGPVTLTLDPSNPPAFVAYQDGDGPWKTLSGSGGTYTFTVTQASGRYGLALGQTLPSVGNPVYSATVWQVTRQELPTIALNGTLAGMAVVRGRINGLSGFGSVYIQNGGTSVSPSFPDFSLLTEKGTRDLAVQEENRVALRRNLSVQADTELPAVDMVTEAFALEPAPVTINGLAGESGFAFMNFQSAHGAYVPLGMGEATATYEGRVLPASRRIAGDLHMATAYVTGPSGGRMGLKVSDLSGPLSVDLPGAQPAPTIAFASSPTRLSAQWQAVAGATFYGFRSYQQQGAGDVSWDVRVTPGWMGSTSPLSYTTPDLSGVQGFDLRWVPSATAPTSWELDSYRLSFEFIPGKGTYTPKNGDTVLFNWSEGFLNTGSTLAPRRERGRSWLKASRAASLKLPVATFDEKP